MENNRLFVGGLSWNTSDGDLRQAFETYGTVDDAKVITDRESGRSRGFGFVTFADAEDASDAIEKMNGTELDGRTINVNVAKARSPRGGNGGGGRW
jgi:RNA recognition motif-containing protein